MSDDEEETARLRAMRNVAARMDARSGGGMQELLDRAKRNKAMAASRSSAFYDDDDDARGQGGKRPKTSDFGGRQEGKPEPLVLKKPTREEEEEAALRAMLPGGFGGVKPGAKRAAEERERVIATQGAPRAMEGPQRPIEGPQRPMEGPQRPMEGPVPPPGPRRPGPEPELDDDESDDDSDGDDGSDDDVDDFLPTANEAVMEGHKKIVSCMALEHTGSRLLTGSHDYGVKIYDFNGMKRDLRPFREIVPADGYPVHALSWSPTGDQFLCVTGHPQPKIYDRDGRELGEFDKGDMYIRDLKNTKGHCSPCTGGAWHPYEKHTVLTSSADGSMRVWDVNYLGHPRGAQASVLKPALAKPGRVQVTACCYSPDGSVVAGAVSDGSIQIFPTGSQGFRSASVGLVMPPSAQCHFDNHWSYASRPKTQLKKSHPPGETVTSVAFSRDGNTLLSRCQDGTLRVWDMRNASKVVKTFDDLETTHEETSVGFSPNDDFFFTGVDAPMSRADKGDGALAVFSKSKLEMVRKVGVPGNCVSALWHQRLNQVFIGAGDHKSGCVRVLYDEKKSTRGMLVCVGRKTRKESQSDFVNINVQSIAYVPHALPMFQEPMPGQKAKGESFTAKRKDPLRTKIPQEPTPNERGGTLLTQHIMKGSDMIGEKNWRTQDPREAILRHAKDAEENPWTTNNAYKETQPVPIFHQSDEENSDSD